jgi:C4-dicarboxylate transporter, DctM subunit
MMEQVIILFLLFFVLLIIGVPIAVALGVAGSSLILIYSLGFCIFSPNVYGGIGKFPLLAIPYFILAGVILTEVGIAQRIISFFKVIVGSFYGGLAIVVVIAALFWGAVSGSGPATVAALGTMLIPLMEKEGYPIDFSTPLICASSGLAIVIPPSIALIIYGTITGDSITALFSAGIIPGIITGVFIAITAWVISKHRAYRGEHIEQSWNEIWRAFVDAIWGFLAPVIILGGIYSGIFTPTEAAIVGAFYGAFIGFFVYRNLKMKRLYELLIESCVGSSVVMIIVAFASIFSWVGHVLGVMETSANFIIGISENPYIALLLIQILIIAAGMLIDPVSIYYVFVPIFIPIMMHFKWNSIWFGILMTVNIAVAQITPPIAVNLFVGSNVSGLSIEKLSKKVIVFIFAILLSLIILTLFPKITLIIPEVLGHLKI